MDLDDEELRATRKMKGLEKTADEMFEEFGYTKSGNIEYYKDYNNIIYFDIENKTFHKTGECDAMCDAITMQELKAIIKKCEELGWI